jgi:hypothetical protein
MNHYRPDLEKITPEMFAEVFGVTPEDSLVMSEGWLRNHLNQFSTYLRTDRFSDSSARRALIQAMIDCLNQMYAHLDMLTEKRAEMYEKMVVAVAGGPDILPLKRTVEEYVRNKVSERPDPKLAAELKEFIFRRALEAFYGHSEF